MITDYYSSAKHWQEYECPRCGLDNDVSPIPMPGTIIRCGCGASWSAGDNGPNTYAVVGGETQIVEYPQPVKNQL